jgi:hypothetical protein
MVAVTKKDFSLSLEIIGFIDFFARLLRLKEKQEGQRPASGTFSLPALS